ncbi:RDD family protein [Alcanivorax jadensis]|uniref:RDD family protein n=1 Tax=Alcanivorax jadensis TaxID=64988 RepID=UPI0026EBB24B|nr:RDD family protein [Alcanivorax jadensis]
MTDNGNPYQSPTADAQNHPSRGNPVLASRWHRFFGAMIDGLIQGAIIAPIVFFSGSWADMMANNGVLDLTTTLVWFIVGEVIFLALQGWLLFNRQQTIGKWLLGMKIIGMEQPEVPAGKLYGLRYLLFHVLAQVPGVNLIMLVDPLLIFRADRRCLHDLLAGTQVIQAPANR